MPLAKSTVTATIAVLTLALWELKLTTETILLDIVQPKESMLVQPVLVGFSE